MHHAVESVIGIPTSQAELTATLERFYGFVLPWECRLERWSVTDGSDVADGRWKTPFLERDLRYWKHTAQSLNSLQRCSQFPVLNSACAALGAMYVLEGATLGGRVIATQLRASVVGRAGYSYFDCYGERTGSMWNSFRQTLASASSPESDSVIVGSAKEMFACVHGWFRPERSVPALSHTDVS